MLGTPQNNLGVLSDWLKFEEDSRYSRDNVVIKSGSGVLLTGTMLAMVAVGVASAALDGAAGNATFGPVTVGKGALQGKYVVAFDSPTKFTLEDPLGVQVGGGTAGVAFNKGGLGFTITAGGTPMVDGDRAIITVAPGSGKYVPFDPAGSAGADVAAGILVEPVDATLADTKAAALVRHAHIAPSGLVFAKAATTNEKAGAIAALRDAGILTVREA